MLCHRSMSPRSFPYVAQSIPPGLSCFLQNRDREIFFHIWWAECGKFLSLPLGEGKKSAPRSGRALAHVEFYRSQDPLLAEPAALVLALLAEELLSSAFLASRTAWISFLAPRVRDWAFSQKASGSIWS